MHRILKGQSTTELRSAPGGTWNKTYMNVWVIAQHLDMTIRCMDLFCEKKSAHTPPLYWYATLTLSLYP